MAAACWRTPPKGTPKSPIGEIDCTPGSVAMSSIEESVGEIGWIEVRSSLPGIVSASQRSPICRMFWAAVPSATTMARPITSAPAVSVVRLMSRASELRASRSSFRKILKGMPASRSSGPSTSGTIRTATSIRPYTTSGPRLPRSNVRRPDPWVDWVAPDELLGQTARAATASTPKTSTSQRSRAPPSTAPRGLRLSASTGGIRPARQAGSSEAASVISTPMTRASTIDPSEMLGASRAMGPVALTHESVSEARPMPPTTPTTDPIAPSANACSMTRPMTCERVAPAARSNPTSRNRSVTVIESVLKIRNAPAKRTTAATSSSVPRKSTVSARSESAVSDVRASRYGSVVIVSSRWPIRSLAVTPGWVLRSTRVTPVISKRAWAEASGTITSRPAASGTEPSPDTMPTIEKAAGPVLPPLSVIGVGRGQEPPAREWQVVQLRLRHRVDPEHGHRRRRLRRRGQRRARRQVGLAFQGGCDDIDSGRPGDRRQRVPAEAVLLQGLDAHRRAAHLVGGGAGNGGIHRGSG